MPTAADRKTARRRRFAPPLLISSSPWCGWGRDANLPGSICMVTLALCLGRGHQHTGSLDLRATGHCDFDSVEASRAHQKRVCVTYIAGRSADRPSFNDASVLGHGGFVQSTLPRFEPMDRLPPKYIAVLLQRGSFLPHSLPHPREGPPCLPGISASGHCR